MLHAYTFSRYCVSLLACILAAFPLLVTVNAHAQLQRNWASYYGNDSTRIVSVQYDSIHKAVYIAGITTATNLASTGAHKTVLGNQLGYYKTDMFLARFDTGGNRIWATYFGGEGDEMGVSMCLDRAGNILLSGNTGSSSGIATVGSFMPQRLSAISFLVKFSPNGQQLWGTYYGSADTPTQIFYNSAATTTQVTVDANNYVYLYSGFTSLGNTTNVVTSGTHQTFVWPPNNSLGIPSVNVLVAKFDPYGTRQWATFYGGQGSEIHGGIVADDLGNVYIAGRTSGSDSGISYGNVGYAVGNVLLNNTKSFLAKLNSSGQIVWGGYMEPFATGISLALDKENNVYMYGDAFAGSQVGTSGTHQSQLSGNSDVYLIKYDSSGTKQWGSYFGGSGVDASLHMDYQSPQILGQGFYSPMRHSLPFGNKQKSIYINGLTTSTGAGIAYGCAYVGENSKRGFLANFNTETGQLNWGSYYDALLGDVAVDKNDGIYIGGFTPTNNIATAGSFQSTKPTDKKSGVLAKLSYGCPLNVVSLNQYGDSLVADIGFIEYKWYRDGVLVHTGTTPIYHFGTNYGEYYVVGVLPCDCFYPSRKVTVNGVGINDISFWHKVTVYPNPATTQLYITNEKPFDKNTTVTLIDVLGRTVSPPQNIGGLYRYQMPLNAAPGLYTLVFGINGERYYKKVMVK